MEDLKQYLEQMAGEGVADSPGGFTIDTERARQKLNAFTYRDPHHYLLSWVRAATLGGARHLQVVADPDRVSVDFDGTEFHPHSLSALFGALLVNSGNPRLYHLARGIDGARRLYGGAVDLLTGGQCYRYLPHHMAPRVGPAGEAGPPVGRSRLQVARTNGLSGMMRRLLGRLGPPQELELARRVCGGVCPVFLTLNGQTLEPPPGHPLLLYASARAPAALLHFLGSRRPLVPTHDDCQSPLVIIGELQGQDPGHWVLVIGGVATSWRSCADLPGLSAIVYADHLTLDMSDSEVVEDAALQAVIDRVGEVYREALPILLTDRSSQVHSRDTGTACLTTLLERQAVQPLAPDEARLLATLEQLHLLQVTEPQPGEPAHLSLRNLRSPCRSPRRLYLLSKPFPPKLKQPWPRAARFSSSQPGLGRLFCAAALTYSTDDDQEEEIRGARVLVYHHERQSALPSRFASAWRQGQRIGVPIDGHLPLELDLARGCLTGPDPAGRWVKMRWLEIVRCDIERRWVEGDDCLYLALADGQSRILLCERCRYSHRRESLAHLLALPATLQVPARLRGPESLDSRPLDQILRAAAKRSHTPGRLRKHPG